MNVMQIQNPPRLIRDRAKIQNQRSAFTLVELLSAMAVVAILVTLVVQVIGSFLSQAKDSATKATLTKIQALLNSRQQAFDRLIQRNQYVEQSYEYTVTTAGYRDTKNNQFPASTRRILAIKLLQRKYFPQGYNAQSYSDVSTNPVLLPNIVTPPAGKPGVAYASSSEILYDFLTQENVLGETPIGTDAFSAAEVKDAKYSNGLPEIYDAWGNELRFYRWPTRLFRAGGQGSQISGTDVANAKLLFTTLPSAMFQGNLSYDLARDPDDPLGVCADPKNFPNFEGLSPPGFPTPATFHVMVVVSAGPDGQFGMFAPDDSDSDDTLHLGHLGLVRDQNALADDIISLSVRAGGK
jgi:prepilin-type N-terminal cleavage/methylation domain-containing protein